MDFATKVHQDVYERVGKWMTDLFGVFVQAMPDMPMYMFIQNEVVVQILVLPWGDDDATISARSWVAYGVELTPKLMHFLLRENADFRFGAFAVDDDGGIFFEHTIVGNSCDPDEVTATVLAVAGTSSCYAAKIIPEHGGVSAADKLRQVLRS